jgi:hypothetical protein
VRVAHQDRTDTAMAGHLRAHVNALAAERVAVTPLLRPGAPQTVLAQVASELDAALVLVGTSQARQGFASALGGSYEALQAALPCPVYRVSPPAAGDPRGWDLVWGGLCDAETTEHEEAGWSKGGRRCDHLAWRACRTATGAGPLPVRDMMSISRTTFGHREGDATRWTGPEARLLE